MRHLAQLAPDDARQLGHILAGEGIEAQLEPEDDGRTGVWVILEQDLESARALRDAFAKDPSQPHLEELARIGRVEAERMEQAVSEHIRAAASTAAQRDRAAREVRAGPVTVVVLAAAAAFTWLGIGSVTELGNAMTTLPHGDLVSWAMIDDLTIWQTPDGTSYTPFLGAVRRGEVWRLITPVFVHSGGLFHLLFNGWWFWDFGKQIETRKGSVYLLFLVLLTGSLSMLAQYAVGWAMTDVPAILAGARPTYSLGPIVLGGPLAGGLSGVLYGLFGYVWAKSATDKFSGLGVSSNTVGILILWLIVCFTGTVGGIANIAHLSGLLVGVLWGAAGHRLRKSW